MSRIDTLKAFPDIQTPRLHLRALNEDDAEALEVLTNHTQITEIVHFLPTPFTVVDAKKLILGNADGQDRFIGVWLHGCADMVAVIGTHLQDGNEIEVGYWVHPEQQRKGIAREAVTALIEKLSEIFPQRQIVAECRPENQPSWTLLEKIGFDATDKLGHRPGRYRFLWKQSAHQQ